MFMLHSCQAFSSVYCVEHYLMDPEAFDDRWFICSLWPRQTDALDDPRDIAQIEQVMGLCRGW